MTRPQSRLGLATRHVVRRVALLVVPRCHRTLVVARLGFEFIHFWAEGLPVGGDSSYEEARLRNHIQPPRPMKHYRCVSFLTLLLALGALPANAFQGRTVVQEVYLKASNTDHLDRFGLDIAVWGDTLVVGAPNESSSATGVNGNQLDNSAPDAGAVYVFVRQGTTWVQQAYLKASNTEAGDYFGAAVDIHGDTLVVGAWSEDSAAPGMGGSQGDNSATEAGAVYVFERVGTTWSQSAFLKASNAEAGDQFGRSLGLAADLCAWQSKPDPPGKRNLTHPEPTPASCRYEITATRRRNAQDGSGQRM